MILFRRVLKIVKLITELNNASFTSEMYRDDASLMSMLSCTGVFWMQKNFLTHCNYCDMFVYCEHLKPVKRFRTTLASKKYVQMNKEGEILKLSIFLILRVLWVAIWILTEQFFSWRLIFLNQVCGSRSTISPISKT